MLPAESATDSVHVSGVTAPAPTVTLPPAIISDVADQRGAEGVGVEATGVRTDDRLVDAAVAAFPDAAEAVDEEVVADVAPAVAVDVVGVDRPDDARHLRLRVAVGVVGVVDEAH